jgi:hypothetical protein
MSKDSTGRDSTGRERTWFGGRAGEVPSAGKAKEMEMLIVLIAIVLFAGAALVWGADSRLGLNDPEWDRRKIWDTRNQELLRH